MTIPLTGTDGLFTRLGRIAGCLRNLNGFLGSTPPVTATQWGTGGPEVRALGTNVDNIHAQFQSTNQHLVDGLYVRASAFRANASTFRSYLRTLARDVAVQMADDDVVLTSRTIGAAIRELVRQMESGGHSVAEPAVSITGITAGDGNNGDGACVASVVGPDGQTRHYVFAETLDLVCVASSQEGTPEGREVFQLSGDRAEADPLSHEWPRGSGALVTISVCDPAEDAGTNLLTNGDFESFTSNVPHQFAVLAGSAGTDIFETSIAYRGVKGLEFRGTGGAPLSSIAQTFSDGANGTSGELAPLTVYAFNVQLRKSATATGTLAIDLVDGDDSVINDAAGAPNTLTKDISTLTTSYAAFSGFFRTPAALPSVVKLRIRLSGALNSGQSVYIDDAALCQAVEAYPGGPYVAIFRGSQKFIKNDAFAIDVQNNYAGVWQQTFERLFGMRSMGLQLPTSSTPTVPESLIS